MKIINSGSSKIKFATQGKLIELNKNESAEIDARTFDVLKKIFPALIAAVEAKEEVVIEAEAQPIETKKKGRKNGTSKKSK